MSNTDIPVNFRTHTPLANAAPPQAAPPPDYPSLSPEGLLIFCQSRLRDMDNKIQAKMADQQKLVALQDAVSVIQSAIKLGDATGGNDKGTAYRSAEVINSINTKIDQAIRDANAAGKSDLVQTLANVRTILNAGPPGTTDDVVLKEEVKDMSSMLDNALSGCRSGAEVSMIELQSLVSKRATQLQLTTGMMNSIDEAPKAIAGNIGR